MAGRPLIRRIMLCLALVVLAGFVAFPIVSDRALAINECLAGMNYVPNQLVVGFKPGENFREMLNRNRFGAVYNTLIQAGVIGMAAPAIRLPSGSIVLFDLQPGTDLCVAMPIIRSLPEVQFVEPNLIGGPPPGGF